MLTRKPLKYFENVSKILQISTFPVLHKAKQLENNQKHKLQQMVIVSGYSHNQYVIIFDCLFLTSLRLGKNCEDFSQDDL